MIYVLGKKKLLKRQFPFFSHFKFEMQVLFYFIDGGIIPDGLISKPKQWQYNKYFIKQHFPQ